LTIASDSERGPLNKICVQPLTKIPWPTRNLPPPPLSLCACPQRSPRADHQRDAVGEGRLCPHAHCEWAVFPWHGRLSLTGMLMHDGNSMTAGRIDDQRSARL